jgi:hypothetical protein
LNNSRKSNAPLEASQFDTALYEKTDSLTLANHPELASQLFAQRGLTEYYSRFLDLHPNDSLFYHSQDNAVMTALNCFEGALYSRCSTSEIKVLLVAGLYHDAAHLYGNYPEAHNIANAKACLKKIHLNDVPKHHALTDSELTLAISAIDSTAFPHATKLAKGDVNRILRDADAMTLYCSDKVKKLRLFEGLLFETHTRQSKTTAWDSTHGAEMSMATFCEQQEKFAGEIVWNTHWGKMKAFNLNWPQKNKELCFDLKNKRRAFHENRS